MPPETTAALQDPIAGFSWDVPVDLSRAEVQARLSASAIKGFFRIARSWKLRDEDARQLLGGVSNGAFYHLKGGKTKKLDQDQLTRVSLTLGIFKALNILYSERLADAWISLPNSNPIFRGETPLTYMMKGGVPAMLRVRQLVDARRGGR
ncbi:MAG TPA: antitoxin Xre/MbcA/ParS toxin-binding domain-containing protein [Verrucomicrobiae bacterium]|nr:antitoxin Xre/MbcA/ParS toxin-binding domain-containing protein [Verrucomicrobiae bacterium]